MDDVISRQVTIDKINERQRKLIYCFGFENDAVKIMDIAKSIVITMPSAQPEIIHCKNCKHRDSNDCPMYYEEWIEIDEGDGYWMKLETLVKVYFDDVQGMIDEIKRLQTYKLFEGDDMVLVDLDAVVTVMANHVRADKCSESPNGWIPCTERLPDYDGYDQILATVNGRAGNVRYINAVITNAEYDDTDKQWYINGCAAKWVARNGKVMSDVDVLAWMPLPEPWKGEEE